MYVAEDGTQVPPAPEEYGPRRLMRYRREYLAEVRGEPPLHTQGVPIVPAAEPSPDVLEIQRRFEALSHSLEEHGEFVQLGENAEFDAFIAGDSSAVKFQEEDVLNAVQRHILGESGSVADTPSMSINPAHLSGFSSTDIKRDYDEHVLGPVTMGVPVVFGSHAPETDDVAGGATLPAEEQRTSASTLPVGAPEEAPSPGAIDPGDGAASLGSEVSASSGTDATTMGDAGRSDSSREATENSVSDASPSSAARPVRAMDAHGLDLSGMDRKAPKSGSRIAVFVLIALLLIAAVVLGIVFLL